MLATPLTPDEEVDEESLRRLIRRVLDADVNGVVILGSAGEGPILSETARRKVIEVVAVEVNGRVPVVVGTGDTSTKRTIENNRAAAREGMDAALVVPPYYFPMNPQAVERFYRELAEDGSLPIIVYNIPQLTKISISLETARVLSGVEGIIGIKDSSGDFAFFQRLVCEAKSESFRIFQGRAALSFVSLVFGADGTMDPMGNIDPKLGVELYDAVKRGDWHAARECQVKLMSLASVIGYGPYPVCTGLKAVLSLEGICGPTVTSPMPSLTGGELEGVRKKLGELGLI